MLICANPAHGARMRPNFGLLLLSGLCAFAARDAAAANLTPPNLGGATTLADQDLFVVWPNASNGPLESIQWSTLRAQIASGLGSTWLLPANNLSELTNVAAARSNLGLGTAATANTGTSGATVPLLNITNDWSATQGFETQNAGAFATPALLENYAVDAGGDAVGLYLIPSATAIPAVLVGYRDGAANDTGIELEPALSGAATVFFKLSSAGALQLRAYGAGLLQTDASGNISASWSVASPLTLRAASLGNALIVANASVNQSAIIYPATNADGIDTDLRFNSNSGNTYAGDTLILSGADGTVTAPKNLTADGNVTLGSGASNTVTVNAAQLMRPNMPAFSAKLSAALTGVTGDATTYTVPFNTAIFDRHGDFNTTTGVFTVPFTGVYQCSVRLTLTGVMAVNNRFQLQMFGAGGGSNTFVIDFGKLAADSNTRVGVAFSDIFSLLAGNTLSAKLEVEGNSGRNVGVLNDAGGGSSAPTSAFGCYLVG